MTVTDPCSQVVAGADVELPHAVRDIDQDSGLDGGGCVLVHVIDLPRALGRDLDLNSLAVDLHVGARPVDLGVVAAQQGLGNGEETPRVMRLVMGRLGHG